MAAKRKKKCDHCGKSYAKTESMNLHVKKVHKGLKIKTTVHKGTKQFSCTFCDKKYTQAHNLKSHIKIVHEGQKAEKVYKCSSCDRSFTQSHSLKSHIKTHKLKVYEKSTTTRRKFTKKSPKGETRDENPIENTVHKGNKIEPKSSLCRMTLPTA